MIIMENLKYDIVKAWLDNVAFGHSRAQSTRYKYTKNMELFCQFAGSSPQQILREYESSEERVFKRKWTQILKAWISSLSSTNLAQGSIVDRVASIKSFFRYNDLPLGFLPRARMQVTYHNRDIEKEEILAIIEQSRPREKAFFSFMVQSGLRPDTIRDLQFRDLESLDKIPCKVTVPRMKTKGEYDDYFTFIGEDAIRFLKSYLATRKNQGPTDYLFTDDAGVKQVWKTLPSVAFQRTARRLRDSGKLSYTTEKVTAKGLSQIRLYNLRKYFRKQAYQAGADFVNFWMGHKFDQPVDQHYFSRDTELHRKVYGEKAMPYLRLETATPSETERTIERQAEEIKELKRQLANVETEKSDLKDRMARTEQKLSSIEKLIEDLKKQLD